jgi:hypothetical protein
MLELAATNPRAKVSVDREARLKLVVSMKAIFGETIRTFHPVPRRVG